MYVRLYDPPVTGRLVQQFSTLAPQSAAPIPTNAQLRDVPLELELELELEVDVELELEPEVELELGDPVLLLVEPVLDDVVLVDDVVVLDELVLVLLDEPVVPPPLPMTRSPELHAAAVAVVAATRVTIQSVV